MLLMFSMNSVLSFVSLMVVFSSVLVGLKPLVFPERLPAPSSALEMSKSLQNFQIFTSLKLLLLYP